jgi:6-phosphogluconolactonase
LAKLSGEGLEEQFACRRGPSYARQSKIRAPLFSEEFAVCGITVHQLVSKNFVAIDHRQTAEPALASLRDERRKGEHLNLNWKLLMATAATAAVSLRAGDGGSAQKWNTPGAVFLMTNDANHNEVISYERTPDGQLFIGDRYDTGGRGSGGTGDPLQSQGSLTLSQDRSLLFAANAGSGTVSVFRVRGAKLRLADEAESGGSEPLSIAQRGDLVYVLNGAAAGSVVAFRWDDHKLRQIPNGTRYLSGTSAGGSSVAISPDGKTVAVTERLTNSIDTFAIRPDGTLGAIVVNKSASPGVFDAAFAPQGVLVVSETGPAGGTNASTLSSYAIASGGTLTAVTQSVPTLGAANCWNAVAPNGKWVYTSNAASSTISGFSVAANGALTPIGNTVVGANPPGSGNLDIAVSSDSRYVYTLNSAAGTIGTFAIQSDGSLVSLGQVSGLPAAAGFNGIAAL